MLLFVGTAAPDKAVYDYLHSKGITCILGTMGNLDKSVIANPNQKVYEQLLGNGDDIFYRQMNWHWQVVNLITIETTKSLSLQT